MSFYIYQNKQWPNFTWDSDSVNSRLVEVRHEQGRLLGRMENLGFNLKEEATLQTLTQDVVKTSEIEGEVLNENQVRSSIVRRLDMNIAGLVPSDRNVDGVVKMTLDATQNYSAELNKARLFDWHTALFPNLNRGVYKIVVGDWRNNTKDDPMQVVSVSIGKEIIHFQAPDAKELETEMNALLVWINKENRLDLVLKAGIAHLWFVTLHPFDDGNGRIARAITDMFLARADKNKNRFYSMSAQIRAERNEYYTILEKTQKGDLDITEWLLWFLNCFQKAVLNTNQTLNKIIFKSKFWEKASVLRLNERQKLMINKLLDGFDGKLNSSKWAKITKCSQDTAIRDIQNLVDKQILQKEAAGGRSTSYFLNENFVNR
ncbi:Fic family protein [Pedobacter frigidisoli]|uniref:Fic family protein n=1 Tax=Pedobacter frigidisoli TaxID=2530455 RepID=A0A4R0P582_9SPHI|nr:Fic family protein [Pedobacter frigidisoli]TCD10469.1 Fic family protein [Pedobacter frigidisoli]